MITHKELEQFILELPEVWLEYPFGESVAVYKFGQNEDGKGKMFALIDEQKTPVRISLKCDPKLAQTLREKYESVQPGFHLNKKHWNTIICTGQLPEEELHGLIRHSYQLVGGQIL